MLPLQAATSAANDNRQVSPFYDSQDSKYYLPYRGFKNVRQGSAITGFQLELFSAYYRGVYLTLIEDVEVTVDGETFKRDQIAFSVEGRSYAIDELNNQTDKRWQWNEPATITVKKPGGLKPGMHSVEATAAIRISYMPTIPTVMRYTRKMPLVY
jgi:Domain of unknown function (DUF6379)